MKMSKSILNKVWLVIQRPDQPVKRIPFAWCNRDGYSVTGELIRPSTKLAAAPAKYGRGVPPGEAFTLTDSQLKEWRKR